MNLNEKVEQIKRDKKPQKITPRELLSGLNLCKRTPGNCTVIDKYLEKNLLEVSPSYTDTWIDSEIELRHKKIAETKIPKDPIKRVRVLEAANRLPKFVSNNAKLRTAITLMQMNKYSQLPVTNNGVRGIVGYISWESISEVWANGIESEIVKDYVKEEIQIIYPETPLLDAVKTIYRNDFAIVIGNDKSMLGIITTADISSIDDLSFGDYKCIIENPRLWDKLKIDADNKLLVERLDEIRKIRNEIMHFAPDSIDEKAIGVLDNTSKYLGSLIKYKYRDVREN